MSKYPIQTILKNKNRKTTNNTKTWQQSSRQQRAVTHRDGQAASNGANKSQVNISPSQMCGRQLRGGTRPWLCNAIWMATPCLCQLTMPSLPRLAWRALPTAAREALRSRCQPACRVPAAGAANQGRPAGPGSLAPSLGQHSALREAPATPRGWWTPIILAYCTF